MLLQATNIRKSYTLPGQAPIPILKGIDLSVRTGEMLTVIGASGSGKTTLLNLLGTLDTPDQGEILFEGSPLFSKGRYLYSQKQLAAFRNRKIGFVFQFHHLLSDFTALENVALPEFIATGKLPPAKKQAETLLAEFGLMDRHDHLPSELSGGEQQRVAIARALMNDPKLILADEPSGNLDSMNSRSLYELMAKLSRERQTSFVIVTHNEAYAAMADRCLHMQDGLLKECGNRQPLP
ncbi:MAG: ABC transporter ATP-binding protein [Chlorobium sp.]|jgi:lipoprotein-releasing system ATP-binding protein|uniref:ABC transporter ATP-binding protein n=1 Tax=Chlorobium sp. TaxID=1095 RepID=UPI001D42B99C|nr:ABC transporter ATP-binding protein [Chlorobium sp.]MBN1279624.1 ABC transporter ATP-binding protein [Chlorobiaceae bacterium]MCF8215622.1 ABC transporter ATP-binding protein [Chlorobium sp.]MCF8270677.1 ABC transporter ATP-binding protein [Chlorobium sp.]MCF8286831.1 ABC transporter ATP-binding protein [Chlorobium sp.]MCF8290593.1 ABC transporter ATP-binding protein [Chlorobium sp.]